MMQPIFISFTSSSATCSTVGEWVTSGLPNSLSFSWFSFLPSCLVSSTTGTAWLSFFQTLYNLYIFYILFFKVSSYYNFSYCKVFLFSTFYILSILSVSSYFNFSYCLIVLLSPIYILSILYITYILNIFFSIFFTVSGFFSYSYCLVFPFSIYYNVCMNVKTGPPISCVMGKNTIACITLPISC